MSGEILRGYWDEAAPESTFSHAVRVDWLSARLKPTALILDYGCGYGRTLEALHQDGWINTLGVDFSGEMIQRGRRQHPHLRLEHIQGLPLSEPDSAFDAILLMAVLTCIPSDDEQARLIGELTRVLRPGGLLFVSDYPLQTDERNLARYRDGLETHGVHGVFERPDGGVFRHHDLGRFRALLSRLDWLECEEVATRSLSGAPTTAVQILARKREG